MKKTLIIAATLVASLSAVANDHTGHKEATAPAAAATTTEAKKVDCSKKENAKKEECKKNDHAAVTPATGTQTK